MNARSLLPVLAALLSFLAGCGGSSGPVLPAGPPPLRLVEVVDGLDVVWPRRLGEGVPEAVSPSSLARIPRPGRVSEVLMHDGPANRELRVALLAPQGAAYRYRVVPPRDAVLRLGLGYVLPGDGEAGREVSYRVSVETPAAAGDAVAVLAETRATEPHAGWVDREMSLAAWAGEEIVLELAAGPAVAGEAASAAPVWAAFSTPEVVSGELHEPEPDVILVSLDTLRADHLGSYGYHRPTSPHLDRLAASGYRFEHAVSQSPWTRPSHRSLFSGQYPLTFGGERTIPLASTLWKAGWRTGAITGGGQVSHQFGFHRGFESYRVSYWVRRLDEVTRWLDAARGRRNFLFLHTFEIHDPYDHDYFARDLPSGRVEPGVTIRDWQGRAELTAEEREYVEALYDSGIRYTDEQIGRLFAALDERGILERAIVIVTSDHGEQFWEHGSWVHGSTVYDHQLLVPLVIHLPESLRRELHGDANAGGRVISRQVRLIDLYPTLMDLLGLEPLPGFQGRSLRPHLAGRETEEPLAFAEHTNIRRESKALRSPRLKLIYSYHKNPQRQDKEEAYELYDLRDDPGERNDLSGREPEVVEVMRRRLQRILRLRHGADFEDQVPDGIDPELRRELEALGYVGN